MLAQSHKKLKELSVLVLDHDQVRAKTVCAELEETNFDTACGVTDFENILHSLEEYKPTVLIIIAGQITSAIDAQLKTIDQYISFPSFYIYKMK